MFTAMFFLPKRIVLCWLCDQMTANSLRDWSTLIEGSGRCMDKLIKTDTNWKSVCKKKIQWNSEVSYVFPQERKLSKRIFPGQNKAGFGFE